MIGRTEGSKALGQLAPPRALENNDADDPSPLVTKATTDRGSVIEIELVNGARVRVDGLVSERTLSGDIIEIKASAFDLPSPQS